MRKSARTVLTAAALGAAMLVPTVTASAATPTATARPAAVRTAVDCDLYVVNTAALRIRTGPGTGYATIGQLSSGVRVDSIDIAYPNYTWYKVRTLTKSAYGLKAGTTGWVSSDYLRYIGGCYTQLD
ncbi:uncharacterized protein YraI [Streptacidiphilus sp. BW17]|uniref:SH3 domain-containing protein n=1 Tax=Streptacidiphilus sp. BW17 TaxID=3156274 RepID=UPI003512FCD9